MQVKITNPNPHPIVVDSDVYLPRVVVEPGKSALLRCDKGVYVAAHQAPMGDPAEIQYEVEE